MFSWVLLAFSSLPHQAAAFHPSFKSKRSPLETNSHNFREASAEVTPSRAVVTVCPRLKQEFCVFRN